MFFGGVLIAKVAGVEVPMRERIKLYQALENAGFKEIELFDEHLEPRTDTLKNIGLTGTLQKRLASNEPDFWYAAQNFLHEWEGWEQKIFQKKPYIKRIWELYIEAEHSCQTISRLICHENMILGTGKKVSNKTVEKFIKQLKNEMFEWLRMKQYFELIGE